MRRALEIDEQAYGPHHPDVAIDLNNLANLLQATNRLEEAEPLMRRALEIDEQSYGPHHPEVANYLHNLAHLLQATNRPAEAEPLVRRVVEIRRDFVKASGHPHPRLQESTENYRRLLAAMDLPGDEINRRVQSALDEPGTSSTTV
jgi:tetratricopeptide (TPR) repeat protein